MRKYLAAAAVALPLVVAGAAHAAGPWYGEIGYTRTDIDSSDVKAGFNTINLRGGAQVGHLGGEMEAGAGLGDDSSATILGGKYSVRMNYQVGVYAVGFLPVAKGLDLFARVGGVAAQFHESGNGLNTSNHERGWAAGLGLRYFPQAGANGVRAEYTRYGMQDDANNFGVSFVHKF
jgi:outer membrane immunogenic protein